MEMLTLHNLTKILAGVCFIIVASLGHAKTQEVGAIGQIKGSGVLERGKDIVIDGDVGVAFHGHGDTGRNLVVDLVRIAKVQVDDIAFNSCLETHTVDLELFHKTLLHADDHIVD